MQMMNPNKHPGILASHPQGLGKSARQILRVRTAGWQRLQVTSRALSTTMALGTFTA